MAANTTPIFTLTPKIGKVQISTANTNRDGTGTIGTVLTGSTNGTRIHRITIQAAVTTTAGVIRLYISDGTNVHLWTEVIVAAVTPSTTVSAWSYVMELFGEAALILPSGYVLMASTNNAEAFNVFAEGGDY